MSNSATLYNDRRLAYALEVLTRNTRKRDAWAKDYVQGALLTLGRYQAGHSIGQPYLPPRYISLRRTHTGEVVAFPNDYPTHYEVAATAEEAVGKLLLRLFPRAFIRDDFAHRRYFSRDF